MFPSSIKHRPPRAWHKISIQVDSRMTEAAAACLAGLTDTGLEITSSEYGLPETAQHCRAERITAYIPFGPEGSDGNAVQEKIAAIRQFLAGVTLFFPDCPKPSLSIETLPEEDWGEQWKKFFKTFQATPVLTIKPSWEAAEKQENGAADHQFVIEMDPGLAFGTGHHTSTQLALLHLEELFQAGAKKAARVLDVGTGSGILAMACGLYGAAEVLAIDNDPDAVETARQNIIRNRLQNIVTVNGADLNTLAPGFDIVVANITHDILAELAKPLTRLLHQDCFFILSGILKGDQEYSINEIYVKLGLTPLKRRTKDEWAALILQKK